MGSFDSYWRTIIVLRMFTGAMVTTFSINSFLLKGISCFFRSSEWKLYVKIWACLSPSFSLIGSLIQFLWSCFLDSLFNVVALASSTGLGMFGLTGLEISFCGAQQVNCTFILDDG